MTAKLFLSAVLLFAMQSLVSAQRVVRKGMKMPAAKVSAPAALYNIKQFNGKWQEVQRANTKNETTDFTDTLLIAINNGKGAVKDAVSMNMAMQGQAMVEAPATLNIAGDSYSIKKVSEDRLVLQDDDYIRSFKRVSHFYYETVGKDSMKFAVDVVQASIDLNNLKGKWQVYRRQAKPGAIDKNTILIKSITVNDVNADNVASGEIVTYDGNNIMETYPCTVTFSNGQLSISAKNTNSLFTVYKADGNEFNFGKDGIISYSKK